MSEDNDYECLTISIEIQGLIVMSIEGFQMKWQMIISKCLRSCDTTMWFTRRSKWRLNYNLDEYLSIGLSSENKQVLKRTILDLAWPWSSMWLLNMNKRSTTCIKLTEQWTPLVCLCTSFLFQALSLCCIWLSIGCGLWGRFKGVPLCE
jgi:hypothetical protein